MQQSHLDVFSVRDLRTRTSAMIREAENGNVSIITKRGRPTALTVPFNTRLLELGIATDLALVLFENNLISLKKAARLADMPLDVFLEHVGASELPAVNYPADELAEEMKVLL